MQKGSGNQQKPPHAPEEVGANEFLAILGFWEGIAKGTKGPPKNLSNLDTPAPKVEGGPEPCPWVTTPLLLVPKAPDEMFFHPPLIAGAILDFSQAGPTLPPQEEALGKRSTGGLHGLSTPPQDLPICWRWRPNLLMLQLEVH